MSKKVKNPMTQAEYDITYDINGNGMLINSEGEMVAKYIISTDETYILQNDEKIKFSDGDELENAFVGGFYYNYALIDPKTNTPFYIGKGSQNRVTGHFTAGVKADDVCEQLDELTKKGTINQLMQEESFSKKDIVRVVSRFIDERTSFDIESLLIHHVYGKDNLTNSRSGEKSSNFRPHTNWQYIHKFDLKVNDKGDFVCLSAERINQHYIYALVDPDCDKIFYVGKGRGLRLQDHFNDARSNKKDTDKLSHLTSLLKKYSPKDIGRVIAYTDSPASALLMESFYIKFVIGRQSEIKNMVGGHYAERFRAHNDWNIRYGFDLPIIVAKGAPRTDLKEQFLGLKLDNILHEVKSELSKFGHKYQLDFQEPEVTDAGELAIKAIITNSNFNDARFILKIFVRQNRKGSVEVRPIRKSTMNYFLQFLNSSTSLRGDLVFLPTNWVGRTTSDIEALAQRAKLAIDLMSLCSKTELTPELASLLGGRSESC